MKFWTSFSRAVRGWYEAPSLGFECCHGDDPHPLKIGEPMFYTGEPGELYCGEHAPAEEKPS